MPCNFSKKCELPWQVCRIRLTYKHSRTEKIIFALIDLISLEGVYRCVTPGLGVPLERRAKVQIMSMIRLSKTSKGILYDYKLLENLFLSLYRLHTAGSSNDVVADLKDKTLLDLVTVCAELGLNRKWGQIKYKDVFHQILDRLVEHEAFETNYQKVLIVL